MADRQIKYSEKIETTQVLGPGRRAVIWVHGCCFDCVGCIAENFRTGDFKTASPEALAEWFLSIPQCEGLTISGGEPMLQAEMLADMVQAIKKHRDAGVIVYTGFTIEQLNKRSLNDSGIKNFLNNIDLLIDGPYIDELNDNLPYRGSSNQRILSLTHRYMEALDSYYKKDPGRPIEVFIKHNKTLMVGIPGRDQAEIWSKIKKLGEKCSE